MLGRTEPRFFTPPLRKLTPETSYGFGVIAFARDVLNTPLDPWEMWAVIHLGELLKDGRPRFRQVVLIVARQNGKTILARILCLFWQFVEAWPMIVSMSTTLGYAREAWDNIINAAKDCEWLESEIADHRTGTGFEIFTARNGSRHKPVAATKNAGRSLSIDRLLIDELRSHANSLAWDAAYKAMTARPKGQVVCITNQGDDTATQLDSLRNEALAFIKTGDKTKGNWRLGLFEYSAPDGASPLDLSALAYANPNMNYVGWDGELRLDGDDLVNDAKAALRAGGDELDKFLTEVMCQRIRAFNAAISPVAWEAGFVEGDLRNLKNRLGLALDMSHDHRHIALIGAAPLPDARIRVETIREWVGDDAINAMRRDLSGVLRRSGTRKLGWLKGTETAGLGVDLRKICRTAGGVVPDEIGAEWSEVCMGFAEQVESGKVIHNGDPMLTDHVTGVFKKFSGESWKFSRAGQGYANGAYAAAIATWMARNAQGKMGPVRGFTRVPNR